MATFSFPFSHLDPVILYGILWLKSLASVTALSMWHHFASLHCLRLLLLQPHIQHRRLVLTFKATHGLAPCIFLLSYPIVFPPVTFGLSLTSTSTIRSSPVPRRLYPFSLDAAYVWNCLSIAMRSQCRFTFLLLILAYFPLVLLPVPHSPPPVDIPFFICQIVIPLGQGVVLCCVLCTEPCAEMALYKLVRFQN